MTWAWQGSLLTIKHPWPAVGLLNAGLAPSDCYAKIREPASGAATSRNAPSASDSRLGRSKASHIRLKLYQVAADHNAASRTPQPPKLDSATTRGHLQASTREMRPYLSTCICFNGYIQHTHARHASKSLPLCARISTTKITPPRLSHLGEGLTCSDINEKYRTSSECHRFNHQLHQRSRNLLYGSVL